jgi:hypothetical protein
MKVWLDVIEYCNLLSVWLTVLSVLCWGY